MWIKRHLPLYAADGAGSGASGADPGAHDGAGSAAAAAAAAAGAGKPWYDGKASAEIVGHWENKGWPKDDAGAIAIKATEQYRELEKFRGIPLEEIMRKPKPDSPEADIKAFWGKLGAPSDPKEYDFSGIKFADGTALDDAFSDTMRETANRIHLPKDAALEVAKSVVKFMEDAEKQEATTAQAALDLDRAALQKEWGGAPETDRFKANKFIAEQGAKALGIPPEAVAAMEKAAGYKAVMMAMHKVGLLNKEDRFIAGGAGTGNVMSVAQAEARKADLMADKAWASRYIAGGAQERQEMRGLNRIITGDFESAA